jgi:hypothetical protein
MRVLLVNPPLSDPVGPYPAICYLAGFLDTVGYRAELADASLDVLLRLFSESGVEELVGEILSRPGDGSRDPLVQAFLSRRQRYAATVATAVACLQGCDHGALARAGRRDAPTRGPASRPAACEGTRRRSAG